MIRNLVAALALIAAFAATSPSSADDHGLLFVSLTTDEVHRVDMATKFSASTLERGHPLAIWLNDKGVLLASKQNASKFAEQQKALAELIGKGATLIVCPFCMKHYGVAESDLIEGAKLGNPELTGGLLFKDDTRTLTW
ncbi:MAG: DsrE family protein [Rhodospirillales bacterium]|nr:DsrE family protein [Rhodospirillales bacterium]